MSNFTPSVKCSFEFEGDTVLVTLARLKRKDLVKLAPYMDAGDAEGNMGGMDAIQLLDFSSALLPEYIKSFSGLRTADGNELTFEQIAGEAYFQSLIADLVQRLFEISNMGKGDIKNSNRQPTTSTEEPANTSDESLPDYHVSIGLPQSSDARTETGKE